MAREFGIYKAPANYEPQIGGPFDARMLVETKSDLTNLATWRQTDGSIWTYPGMIVAVASDLPENNGLYMLLAKDYASIENWQKLADNKELQDLVDKVENMEVASGADIEVGSFDQLPQTGMSGVTYFVRDTQTIYRWSTEANEYLPFGGSGSNIEDIKMIYGGDSNG